MRLLVHCGQFTITMLVLAFGLVIYSKRLNADAALALVEVVKKEKQDAPAREAEPQKKQIDAFTVDTPAESEGFRP
jgi:hypothetical protein